MATIKLHPETSYQTTTTPSATAGLWQKWLNFTDSQEGRSTLWFMVSLIVQGVFFLPLPAVLIFYFDAPTLILTVTLGLFFANIIAGMSSASVRTILTLFAFSMLLQTAILLLFIII